MTLSFGTMGGFGSSRRKLVFPVDACLRCSCVLARVLENVFEEPVENLRDAAGTFGKMLGRATGCAITIVELSLKRPITPLCSVSLLLGPQICQMAFPAFREGIYAVSLQPAQPFRRRRLLS